MIFLNLNHIVLLFTLRVVESFSKIAGIRRQIRSSLSMAEPALTDNVRTFEELARKGISIFKEGDLTQALKYMNLAIDVNSSQPLIQRGIMLYCDNKYEDAALQLSNDINKLEKLKLNKENELRWWCSACYNKLGREKDAFLALDMDNTESIPQHHQSHATNNTMLFFAGKLPLETMLCELEKIDEKDPLGIRFYGNFYLGLYFDSVGQSDLAESLLSFPALSSRYRSDDMWYHVPRMLYRIRYSNI